MSVQPVLEPTAHAAPPADVGPDVHVKTQLLRRIAHDIASPTGVTQTVLDELAQGQVRPELIAMARRSLRRLMRLSEHLALVAELEADGLDPDLSRTDARKLVAEALEQATAIDGRKDVVLVFAPPAEPLHVNGDARLLTSVFRELIGNALRIAGSRVLVTLANEHGRVTLRVEDDGPGFPEDARAAFGRRFVRKSTRGLGLSLSMAQDVLTEHDGTLTLDRSSLPPKRHATAGAAVVATIPAYPER